MIEFDSEEDAFRKNRANKIAGSGYVPDEDDLFEDEDEDYTVRPESKPKPQFRSTLPSVRELTKLIGVVVHVSGRAEVRDTIAQKYSIHKQALVQTGGKLALITSNPLFSADSVSHEPAYYLHLESGGQSSIIIPILEGEI